MSSGPKFLTALSFPADHPIPAGGPDESAVLVSLASDDNGQEWVLLTKRTQLVETHKGQISFPGGYWDEGDTSVLETALRETEEEIGLRRTDVEILGFLDPVVTRSSVKIHPVVGHFQIPYTFQLSVSEVDKILMLPLERLIKERLVDREIDLGHIKVSSPAIVVEGEVVWGATARILEQLVLKFSF